jgi:hypothetical protein
MRGNVLIPSLFGELMGSFNISKRMIPVLPQTIHAHATIVARSAPIHSLRFDVSLLSPDGVTFLIRKSSFDDFCPVIWQPILYCFTGEPPHQVHVSPVLFRSSILPQMQARPVSTTFKRRGELELELDCGWPEFWAASNAHGKCEKRWDIVIVIESTNGFGELPLLVCEKCENSFDERMQFVVSRQTSFLFTAAV